jgi:hypothetical protein
MVLPLREGGSKSREIELDGSIPSQQRNAPAHSLYQLFLGALAQLDERR